MNVNQLLEQLYWSLKFGRPKRKISGEELFAKPELVDRPVFFLSTGRCGTEWFTHLLKKDSNTVVFHSPPPNLSVQNKFVYEQRAAHNGKEIAIQILFAGRGSYFRQAYKAEKRYVETNNHITFFAYALADLFPSAKFVHLYRHPGDFVTSGINRGWFDDNHSANEKMIVSSKNEEWENYDQIQKIAWIWNETNEFIESFKSNYHKRCISYDFTKRNPEELVEMIDFLELSISSSSIKRELLTRRNSHKIQRFASYQSWNNGDKEKLRMICDDLSEKYQFQL